MDYRRFTATTNRFIGLLILLVSVTGCNVTKNLKEDEQLLRSNSIKLRSDQPITRKGELKDNLGSLIAQKPNSYILGIIPFKLWLYNSRYEKYRKDSANFQLQSKTVEPPVIYDSSYKTKSGINMKGYLFHEGYFYASVADTTVIKDKKAYVTYFVNTGSNYLINDAYLNIPDTTIKQIVQNTFDQTLLKKNVEFRYGLLEEERSRISGILRNYGFYKFTNNNIDFELDTLNKQLLRDIENPFESAINFIALQKDQKKPTLDIKVTIHTNEDSSTFFRYGINRARVFPDYQGGPDFRDSTMIQTKVNNIIFRYRKKDYYIRENVIARHIFMDPEKYYAQSDYDLTIRKLNELGVFQSVRISMTEDTIRRDGHWLNYNIFLNPGKKYDYNTSIEGSTGTTYQAGTALTLLLRNRNLGKGGNTLTTTLSGGLEARYNDSLGDNFFDNFALLTRNAGINSALEFPKFLVPFKHDFSRRNSPRTAIAAGINLLERVDLFTLINTSASFSYRWRETDTKNWEFAPAFMNIIRTPFISTAFQQRLDSNALLRNSYRETFIEGENAAFIYSNREKRAGKDYSYLRVGFEEAGLLLKGINGLTSSLDSEYAQYLKFDLDVQHFIIKRHATAAFRFLAGVGLPYDNSSTLPYIKQYFAGGAYSIRGWRIRTLGPGSYVDTTKVAPGSPLSILDRTGDMRLELNNEFRFDIVQMFSGAINLKGAVFVDAGNIWITRSSAETPNGDFSFKYFVDDLAINTGAGLRLDIAGFFLVRFDAGLPVKYPSRTVNGWVPPKKWSLGDLVPQFGIGYPF